MEYKVSAKDCFKKTYLIKARYRKSRAGYLTFPKSMIGKRIKITEIKSKEVIKKSKT